MLRAHLTRHCIARFQLRTLLPAHCFCHQSERAHLHAGYHYLGRSPKLWQIGDPAATTRLARMASKATDAELVLSALAKVTEGKQLYPLIDIGINLADSSYDKDREQVLKRAKQAGVVALVVTGCDLKTSRKAQGIARSRQGVYFTAGVHPHNAKECGEATLDSLRELASDPLCVAIGECGLDFNRNFSPTDVQEEWFDKQVQLACELHKPLFLHCRDAAQQFAAILRRHQLTAPVVAHCFTGSGSELQDLLSLGLHIGITGWVCDERDDRGGQELAKLLTLIPADKLMIETDGPYITPRTIRPNKARPRRNEPALLPYVLQTVSENLGQLEEQVAARTTATAKAFFGIQKELMS